MHISAKSTLGIGLLILELGLAGCRQAPAPQAEASQPPQKELKPAPATPIDAKRVELGGDTWDPSWDKLVEEALPEDLLSSQRAARDVRPFCPRFSQMSEGDRRAFWAYFFQALAGAEAGLQPTSSVRHTEAEVAVKDDVTKRMVRSQGLLQLTYMDGQRYGCDFDWDADKKLPEKDPARTILQPKNNLECGVKIMHNQLMDQHRPLLSQKSYWSTLQPGRESYRVFMKQMTNVPKACRVGPADQEAKRKTAQKAAARGVAALAN